MLIKEMNPNARVKIRVHPNYNGGCLPEKEFTVALKNMLTELEKIDTEKQVTAKYPKKCIGTTKWINVIR